MAVKHDNSNWPVVVAAIMKQVGELGSTKGCISYEGCSDGLWDTSAPVGDGDGLPGPAVWDLANVGVLDVKLSEGEKVGTP